MLHYHPLVAKLLLTSNITNVDKTRFVFLFFSAKKKPQNIYRLFNFFFLLKNVTEELPLLGLAGLYFLPVGSPVDEVGEGKFGPHVASELI